MKCKICNKEFIKTRPNVDGQIYCTITCRNIAAKNRQYNKIIKDYANTEIDEYDQFVNKLDYLEKSLYTQTEISYKKEIVGKIPVVKETLIENLNGEIQSKYEVKIEDFIIKIIDSKKCFIDIDDISIYIDNSENKNIVVTYKHFNVKKNI